MFRDDELARWLKRGRQRVAVAQAFKKPMTTAELYQAARALNPRIQVRDVWFLMQQFTERKLAAGLNGHASTGRLYYWTDRGRTVLASAFGLRFEAARSDFDWSAYAWVTRAKVRRLVLSALDKLEHRTGEAQTAASLRKHLRETQAVGLNPVIRALRELLDRGLVRCAGTTRKQNRKLYQLTADGSAVLQQLRA